MKVTDHNQRIQMEAYLNKAQITGPQQQNQQTAQGNEGANGKDRVELSSQSRLMQKVNQAMEAQDPERVAKVKEIKEQVQKGTYNIDTEKVAQSMLTDLLKDLG